jgi:hypothetical protein
MSGNGSANSFFVRLRSCKLRFGVLHSLLKAVPIALVGRQNVHFSFFEGILLQRGKTCEGIVVLLH